MEGPNRFEFMSWSLTSDSASDLLIPACLYMIPWTDEKPEERGKAKWFRCGIFPTKSLNPPALSQSVKSHLNLSVLTGVFAGSFWLLKGISNSLVESPTSGHEEENQTQLKAKGQHTQHHYDVNC